MTSWIKGDLPSLAENPYMFYRFFSKQFEVRSGNNEAVNMLDRWVNGNRDKGVLLLGAAGSGKSHLLHLISVFTDLPVLDTKEIKRQAFKALSEDEKGSYRQVVEAIASRAVLIDGLGNEGQARNVNPVGELIDLLYRQGRSIVATSIFDLKELGGFYGFDVETQLRSMTDRAIIRPD